jgi:Carboxypeptidase regulatory-like domain
MNKMRVLVAFLMCWWPVFALAQSRTDATLRVTVVDPSGAVIVGAQVTVTPSAPQDAAPLSALTLDRGEALFAGLQSGCYSIHVESPGFESYDAADLRVRAGDNRREAKLKIAKLSETVQVGRDPRERASDPRGDAFATILGQAQIDELPDDPDEMEQVLRDMGGPGATLRVNGFRGGKLPPKSQIQSIRFRRNMFSADVHEAGVMAIDITTKPGLEGWRGSTGIGFRDAALNARNFFAPVKGDEQHERYGFNMSGPLWKQHTSLSLAVDGIDSFDTKTIVAYTPAGFFNDSVRKPNDTLNVTARVEHSLTKTQMLRAEVQTNHLRLENLGVGDYDLPDRGYSQARDEQIVRGSLAGSIRKAFYNELRMQWRREDYLYTPLSTAPAVRVLNSFNSGGAQISGPRAVDTFEIADDLDIAAGRHAIRTGFLVEGGRYNTDILRNAGGTFTFASLDDYNAGRPTTFQRNVGDPNVKVSLVQTGIYVQDDFRARKDLTISGGLRQEYQSQIGGFHLAPRGGIVWSPFKSGKTTVRAGGGVFFDWFDAQSYEQAVQLDGTHQRIQTVMQPGYPNPLSGGEAVVLPAGRVQLSPAMTQPQLFETMAGVEQQLPRDVRLMTMYIRRRGSNLLRGVNINAPLPNGQRRDPLSGPITEIDSIASSSFDGLSVNLNYMRPQTRFFLAVNYTLARAIDETDSVFSLPADNFNLAAERGPSLTIPWHRFMSLVNTPLVGRFRLGTSIRVQSALPYNITTGYDDNGDTVSNDRPAGVTRNTGRGTMQVDLNMRLSYSIGFGTRTSSGPQGPQIRVVRGDSGDPLRDMAGADVQNKKYGIELYAQAFNLVNHMNALNFSGVMTSPFFGQPTAAAPPRRIELGARLSF